MKLIILPQLFVLFVCLVFGQPDQDEIQVKTIEISDKILVLQFGEVYPDQMIAIRSDSGIVLIDAGISPTITSRFREEIAAYFNCNTFLYLINTHSHFDHTNGNQVFNDAVIVAHEDCPGDMAKSFSNIEDFINRRHERIKRRQEAAASLPDTSKLYKRYKDLREMSQYMISDYKSGYKLTLPEVTFRDYLKITLPGLTLNLFYIGKGFHSDNDVIVSIPELKTVVIGDIIADYPTYPNIWSGSDNNRLNNILDTILHENRAEYILTSHAGILPKSGLKNFHRAIKKVLVASSNKKPGVAYIREYLKTNNAEDVFRAVSDTSKYYLVEGDILKLIEGYGEGEIGGAINILENALQLFPKSIEMKIWLGDLYQANKNYPKAHDMYIKVMEEYPLSTYTFEKLYFLEKDYQSILD